MPTPEQNKLVLLCAGGTGGHLFPAEALALVLQQRGLAVELATDRRAAHFKFPARAVHLIPSATLRGRNPLALARTAALLALGTAEAWALIGNIHPAVVVGFGGYPTVPPLWAASLRGVASVLHEQNGVMGRANRLLAPRVTAIATSFHTLANLDPRLQGKIGFTGNPVRPPVIEAARAPYAAPDEKLRLLVFGGSQGARVMAEIVPKAIEHLGAELRAPLAIVQQARGEDLEVVRAAYAKLGIAADLPKQPDVGYRAVNALIAHGEPVVIPPDAKKVQYEGELAVVIGKRTKHVSEAEALSCVLGYTIGNDVSERTWQKSDRTLWRAKNTDTFKPMGPWIETQVDLEALETRVRVNGQETTRFRTNAMLFGVATYISTISRYVTLYPRDVIWMGTDGTSPDLKAGDTVEVEIAGIGTLRNPFVAGT